MFPFRISPKHTGYNLDRSEEIVLIDSWLRIRGRIGDAEPWAVEFEDRFFGTEKGVSEKYLDRIDGHLKRLDLPLLGFMKTGMTPYMRIRHQPKIDSRAQLAEMLQAARDRAEIVAEARRELVFLPPFVEDEEPVEDAERATRRQREVALERALLEQRRQEQEHRAEALDRARSSVAEAAEHVVRRTSEFAILQSGAAGQGGGLIGGLEALLMKVSAKLDLLVAQGDLSRLEIAELTRRLDEMGARLSVPVVSAGLNDAPSQRGASLDGGARPGVDHPARRHRTARGNADETVSAKSDVAKPDIVKPDVGRTGGVREPGASKGAARAAEADDHRGALMNGRTTFHALPVQGVEDVDGRSARRRIAGSGSRSGAA